MSSSERGLVWIGGASIATTLGLSILPGMQFGDAWIRNTARMPLLWIVDAAWWWLSPTSYAHRSSWISRAIHAFMLFIVVNATMIFETGIVRVMGAAMLLSFAFALASRWYRR